MEVYEAVKESTKIRKEVAALAKRLVEDSHLDSDATAEVLAESIAQLHMIRRLIFEEKISGDGNAEETRTLPALASNIKRMCDTLGVTIPKPDNPDDWE